MRIGRLLWALAACCTAGSAARAEPPFELLEIPGPGRTAAAGFADLDGDGRTDLFSVSLSGIPPRDRRQVRIHYQRTDGSLPEAPDWTGGVTDGAAAFDVADLPDGGGREILLLRRHRVTVLSFAGRVFARRDLAISGDPTVAIAPDERGFDRLRLARSGLGEGVRLLVPGLGRCLVLAPSGEILASLDVGHRADYFIPPRPGPVIGENEIEAFYDFPRLDVADVDGDGRGDVIASNRHEIRVFEQTEDGGFPNRPQLRLALGRLTEQDQIRRAGNVRVVPADLDGDGRADLLVTYTTGGVLRARSETSIHLNRSGSWDLESPDQRFVYEGGWNSFQLIDLDDDGRLELVEARIPLGILELIEVLLTEAIDVEVSIFGPDQASIFEKKPRHRTKLDVPFRLDTLEPRGFVPTLEGDLNGDGLRDRLGSGNGKAIEIYLGGGDRPFRQRAARQKLDTGGTLRFGDLDGDGLTDFLLYDATRPDTPIRIGRNRGVLPGTRASRRSPPGAGGSRRDRGSRSPAGGPRAPAAAARGRRRAG